MTVVEGSLAGLVAGWLCFVSGHWLSMVGLPIVDLGAIGRRYLDAPVGGWVFGLIHHLANSVLLGALYASALLAWREGDPALSLPAGAAVGLAYGVAVWAILAMSLVLPASGRGWFGSNLEDRRVVVANLVVHLIFGVVLGAVAR